MFDIIGRGGGGGGGGHGGGMGGGGFHGGGGGFHGGGFNRGLGRGGFVTSPWWGGGWGGGYAYPYVYPYVYPNPYVTQPRRATMTPAATAAYRAWQSAAAANADPGVIAKLKAVFEAALYGVPV